MKLLVVFLCLCVTLPYSHLLRNGVHSEAFNQLFNKKLLQYVADTFRDGLPIDLSLLDKDEVFSADIDEFADKIVVNIRNLIVDSGFDNVTLPDQINIKPSVGTHLTLTEGSMSGINSMQRYQHATLVYHKAIKKVYFLMILRFTEIDFIFKYQSKVLFVHSTGHLHGKIEKAKINVKLGFDFENYKAFVDEVDVKQTGTIHIWLSGNRGIDWLSNLVIGVVTGILHPLILSIVTNVIQIPIHSVIEAVNEVISRFLHPTSR